MLHETCKLFRDSPDSWPEFSPVHLCFSNYLGKKLKRLLLIENTFLPPNFVHKNEVWSCVPNIVDIKNCRIENSKIACVAITMLSTLIKSTL